MKPHLASLVAVLMIALSSATFAQNNTESGTQGEYKIGDRLAQPKGTASSTGFQTIDWETLVPKDWNVEKLLGDLNLESMTDADPRAMEALEKMQKIWNDAPANRSLDGKRIRLPGFVVPLDAQRGQMKEFLLVPYFGACIHVPPPPANQIIHSVAVKPLKEMPMMQAVWVSGTLEIARKDTEFGASTYRLKAERLEKYTEKK